MNCPDLTKVPKTHYETQTKTITRHWKMLWKESSGTTMSWTIKAKFQFWSVVKDWNGTTFNTDFDQELIHVRESNKNSGTAVIPAGVIAAAEYEARGQRMKSKHLGGYPKSYTRQVAHTTYHDERHTTNCCLKAMCCPKTYIYRP